MENEEVRERDCQGEMETKEYEKEGDREPSGRRERGGEERVTERWRHLRTTEGREKERREEGKRLGGNANKRRG